MSHIYLIALGSNMRVPGIGAPRQVLKAACSTIEDHGADVLALSPIIDSAPIGPSLRRYANAAALIECALPPPQLLSLLQRIEHAFGRSYSQRMGQRWRARALDLDIVLWDGGIWHSADLIIPHREMRRRDFVLGPASAVAGGLARSGHRFDAGAAARTAPPPGDFAHNNLISMLKSPDHA